MTIIVSLLAAGMFDRTTAIDNQWACERNRVGTGWHDTHPELMRPHIRIPRLVGALRRYVREVPATPTALAAGVHAPASQVSPP